MPVTGPCLAICRGHMEALVSSGGEAFQPKPTGLGKEDSPASKMGSRAAEGPVVQVLALKLPTILLLSPQRSPRT